MSTSPAKRYTVEEYCALELTSDVKHEYYNGEVFAMTGGSSTHSLISVNIASLLNAAFRQRDCRVYNGDMRVLCPSGLRTYPDASVVCGPGEFTGDQEYELLNPLLIVEVLSPTTEAYDQGVKLRHYRMIESLKEYVLITQERPAVHQYTKDDAGNWISRIAESLDQSIDFPSLDISVPMAEIYAKVDFPPEPEIHLH